MLMILEEFRVFVAKGKAYKTCMNNFNLYTFQNTCEVPISYTEEMSAQVVTVYHRSGIIWYFRNSDKNELKW